MSGGLLVNLRTVAAVAAVVILVILAVVLWKQHVHFDIH